MADRKLPNTPAGCLPPRVRALYITDRSGLMGWLAESFAGDSASRVLLDEAVGLATGMAHLRDQIYDVVLVRHAVGALDALEFVEGLRASGGDEPVVVLGDESVVDMAALCYEVGADGYVAIESTTTRGLLWTIARAIERQQLRGENRRLLDADRQRLKHEQGEAEQLLAQQHELAGGRQDGSAATSVPGFVTPALPEQLKTHYRELLRAHVIMGSGTLGAELADLATMLSGGEVAAPQVVRMHVEVLEDLVRGLGSRSARHIMNRAGLLVLELLMHLAECYRRHDRDRRPASMATDPARAGAR